MESGKQDDKKKMIQTTNHWAEDRALGKSENESQVTKVAQIAQKGRKANTLESLQHRDNSDGPAKFDLKLHSVWYMCGGLFSW